MSGGAGGIDRVGILGAGAWGTALAHVLAHGGRDVLLWARRGELAEAINATHVNAPYLPAVTLPPALRATSRPEDLAHCEVLLLVTPAQHMRAIAARFAPLIGGDTPLVLCSKGIEQASGALMTEVAAEALPGRPLAVLSGPTFAIEVARGLPAAVTLAADDQALGAALVETLGSRRFRPYLSDDPIGAEVAGAVKNVIAVACGIVAGRHLGDNARAALITRGLAEIGRLAVAKGGRAETLMGLSGLGDLTLTCSAMQSRNFSLGAALGEGRTLTEIMAERRSVAEGVHSAAALTALAARLGVEMPISAAVDQVLNHGADIDQTIEGLLARPFRAESA